MRVLLCCISFDIIIYYAIRKACGEPEANKARYSPRCSFSPYSSQEPGVVSEEWDQSRLRREGEEKSRRTWSFNFCAQVP